ncbi:MAG: hypothetical protein KC502_18300 [Myxococcales bacterium]|nr:hypothetical protein [Myxococcales bacterium]
MNRLLVATLSAAALGTTALVVVGVMGHDGVDNSAEFTDDAPITRPAAQRGATALHLAAGDDPEDAPDLGCADLEPASCTTPLHPRLVLPGDLPPLPGLRTPANGAATSMAQSRAMVDDIERLLGSIRDDIGRANGDAMLVTKALQRFHTSTDKEMARAGELWKDLEPAERARLSSEVERRLRPLMSDIIRAMNGQGIKVPGYNSLRPEPSTAAERADAAGRPLRN